MKLTQKQIREFVAKGAAMEIGNENNDKVVLEPYKVIATSWGTYGCNGLLMLGCETKTLYAITSRCTAIFKYI